MNALTKFHAHRDLGLLALRVVVASIFLYHGLQKLGNFSELPALMQVLAIVEPLAGIMILLGLFTELAALALIFVMIGAIYFKASGMLTGGTPIPFAAQQGTGWEFDLMILAGNIVLLTQGAGKFALGKKKPQ